MSDLSKKLRQMKLPNGYNAEVLPEAAARIEELERAKAHDHVNALELLGIASAEALTGGEG